MHDAALRVCVCVCVCRLASLSAEWEVCVKEVESRHLQLRTLLLETALK